MRDGEPGSWAGAPPGGKPVLLDQRPAKAQRAGTRREAAGCPSPPSGGGPGACPAQAADLEHRHGGCKQGRRGEAAPAAPRPRQHASHRHTGWHPVLMAGAGGARGPARRRPQVRTQQRRAAFGRPGPRAGGAAAVRGRPASLAPCTPAESAEGSQLPAARCRPCSSSSSRPRGGGAFPGSAAGLCGLSERALASWPRCWHSSRKASSSATPASTGQTPA